MRELPVDLPSELVPLSWLLGVWEGTGVLEYTIGDETVSRIFGQRVSFSHDGLPHLNYSSYTWLEPEPEPEPLPAAGAGSNDGDNAAPVSVDAAPPVADAVGHDDERTPLATETGYWRLSRAHQDGDPGPGLLPRRGEAPFTSAAAVENLRNATGGFDIDVTLVHPGGVAELYLGRVNGPRIDLATDAVLRTEGSKPYAAATRLYGLVDNHLLWAWDIAALGQGLRTHASGRLAHVD
ncbi:MAG: FABP family protein [Cryobacterium sp.]